MTLTKYMVDGKLGVCSYGEFDRDGSGSGLIHCCDCIGIIDSSTIMPEEYKKEVMKCIDSYMTFSRRT